jgi:hypothetical protein
MPKIYNWFLMSHAAIEQALHTHVPFSSTELDFHQCTYRLCHPAIANYTIRVRVGDVEIEPTSTRWKSDLRYSHVEVLAVSYNQHQICEDVYVRVNDQGDTSVHIYLAISVWRGNQSMIMTCPCVPPTEEVTPPAGSGETDMSNMSNNTDVCSGSLQVSMSNHLAILMLTIAALAGWQIR